MNTASIANVEAAVCLHSRQQETWDDLHRRYVGLMARLGQHRTGAVAGFTSKYGVWRLVHFEVYDDMYTAISREKQLKAWRRAWKIALIEEDNPDWLDQAVGLGFEPMPPHPSSRT